MGIEVSFLDGEYFECVVVNLTKLKMIVHNICNDMAEIIYIPGKFTTNKAK